MKNIVGQVPRGKNFFIRENLMKLLYRRMDSGANLYIAAPRRMGKTAILRYLEDNPTDAYNAIYVITESVDSTEHFFRTILDELFKSSGISALKKTSNAASELIENVLEQFKKLKALVVLYT
jgi:predicted AAA+ superfamily ATPase